MTKSDYIKKSLNLSHNACCVKFKFHIGDFVSIPSEHIDCAVVVGSCIHVNGIVFYVVRYVISDPLSEYDESYLPERLLVPYVDIGDYVSLSLPGGSVRFFVVRKVELTKFFVYNHNLRLGFWVGFDDIISVKRYNRSK